jgi:aerobic carbon-monoxide dehydrogenase small subunit
MKCPVSVTVNGVRRFDEVEPRLLLVYYLRENLGLTGTNVGCDTSQCGSCTVLLDGRAVKSCTLLAVQADGTRVTTIEGLARNGNLHPLQEAFWEHHGLQCGFCTPGMILTACEILQRHPKPLPLHRLPEHRGRRKDRRHPHGESVELGGEHGVAHLRLRNQTARGSRPPHGTVEVHR